MTLSIGIPVYNEAGTIRETIESCLRQSSPADEIVVSDNHSTDGTARILSEYGSKIKVSRPARFLSMMENWDFCVSQTRGRWVALLSGDDVALPNFAAALTAGTQVVPDAAFVMGGWENIDGDGRVTHRHNLYCPRVTRRKEATRMLLSGPKASFAAFAFARGAFDRAGGYGTHFELLGDWMLQIRIARHGALVRIPECIAQYRSRTRPALEAKRIGSLIADEKLYATKVAWEACELGIARSEIRRACRQRAWNLLAKADEHRAVLTADDVANLAEIARAVERPAWFATWRQGRVPLRPWRQRSAEFARRLARVAFDRLAMWRSRSGA